MNQKIIQTYLEKKYITLSQSNIVLEISKTSHHNVDDVLLACGFATSKQVAMLKASRLDTQYIDLTQFIPEENALELLDRDKALKYSILPLMIKDTTLYVAIDERSDFRHKAYLERITNMNVKFFISSKKAILDHLMSHDYYTQDDEILKKINEMKMDAKKHVDIISLVELLIEDAIEDNVSDIHISPEKDVVNIFYRIDSMLVHYHTLPIEFHEMIVSRVKTMSKLDISNTSLPQDGQIEYDYHQINFRLRVSTVTTSYGENIVMRLLKNSAGDMSLNHLGLSQSNLQILQKVFTQPNGLVLVTGPTGSGKTTTLYSALKEIDSLSKNILTVEDPIEYQIPFIRQTQINVKAGYTFDTAIRAFMRQDPDVILVGEIRDTQTAQLALRASITGHLVLSTLHTNDAVGAIARLTDLGIPQYLTGSATIAVVAQRLVRKLCDNCKIKVEDPHAYMVKNSIPQSVINKYDNFSIYEAKGCDKCSNIGYKSRTMILEILLVDKQIEDMITSSKSSLEILEYASSQGMETLLEDGFCKVFEGQTTLEEIYRVVLSIEH